MKIKNIRVNDVSLQEAKKYSITKNYGHKLKTISALVLTLVTIPILSSCNRAIIDTKYGQNAALISGDDTAIIMDIKDWRDYEGEQYQLNFTNGLVVLSASFDTDLYFGNSNVYSVRKLAKNQLSPNGELHDYYNDKNNLFNYELFDFHWNFNKAAVYNGNKALVLNAKNWRDYEGEQLQVVTEEDVAVLLSSYHSKLFYDRQSSMTAEEFSKMYVGNDGKVTTLGKPARNNSITNYNLIDLNYIYNKAIIMKGNNAIILPIAQWKDYEGEQYQLKILDGPTILTASYDTILVRDSKLSLDDRDKYGALAIANAIADNVIDLTTGKPLAEGFFNKQIIDLDYGFKHGVISTDNSAATFDIRNWKDYEGEQLQIVFPDGDTMLTSSVFLDMINGGTPNLNVNTFARYYGEKHNLHATNLLDSVGFNKKILDFEYAFNYALHVENGNVTILPLSRWKDYYNTNGYKSTHYRENPDGTRHIVVTVDKEDSPNCEQFQLELPEGSCILTSAYDTILLKTANPGKYAEWFRGKDGVVTDLTPMFGMPPSGWNFKLFDTTWRFNYAIYNSGVNSQIFEISKWMDFADGEQVQIYFPDDAGMVSSYINTSLVYSKDIKKVEAIANAFAGVKEEKGKVYKYGR